MTTWVVDDVRRGGPTLDQTKDDCATYVYINQGDVDLFRSKMLQFAATHCKIFTRPSLIVDGVVLSLFFLTLPCTCTCISYYSRPSPFLYSLSPFSFLSLLHLSHTLSLSLTLHSPLSLYTCAYVYMIVRRAHVTIIRTPYQFYKDRIQTVHTWGIST